VVLPVDDVVTVPLVDADVSVDAGGVVVLGGVVVGVVVGDVVVGDVVVGDVVVVVEVVGGVVVIVSRRMLLSRIVESLRFIGDVPVRFAVVSFIRLSESARVESAADVPVVVGEVVVVVAGGLMGVVGVVVVVVVVVDPVTFPVDVVVSS
jgi:hypothetical protein